MTYLDTSVALAHVFGESRAPAPSLWQTRLISSRLLEYELWVRGHAKRLSRAHADAIRSVLCNVDLLELSPEVLEHAKDPFPIPVRTLDAMHLASMLYLREQGHSVMLASYDERLNSAARALDIELIDLA